ncbi:hypothetical protein V8F20_007949 [Naviculisporaceae sp. PSN 640]
MQLRNLAAVAPLILAFANAAHTPTAGDVAKMNTAPNNADAIWLWNLREMQAPSPVGADANAIWLWETGHKDKRDGTQLTQVRDADDIWLW